MNKILLLIDPENFRPSILTFVNSIASPGQSKVIGAFLAHPSLSALPQMKAIGGQVYVEEITLSAEERKTQSEALHNAMSAFKVDCLALGLSFDIHENIPMTYKDLATESRYADLIIADSNLSNEKGGVLPSKLLTELLKHAECPVLIAPQEDKPIDKVVFAYDGGPSSMFAIRQFYHCLPHFSSKKLSVLNIDNGKGQLPTEHDMQLLDEWLKFTVGEYSYERIKGETGTALLSYFLSGDENFYSLLVAGSYGRSALSALLEASTLKLPLKTLDIPAFITHL